ncbi:AAA family ATPase [Hungatella effluvii]|uniref:AAA family ATPase n=1 Tax=Hungatella effluvii TaxID=1096246 RepID=UPI0022DF20BA|nr:AAA family ATPase [Hungatella effluvii]
MLRFEQLIINNFGPFKGVQELSFGDKDGVTIIWGDNGQGKTTLLNAFRYALYGHIKDHHGSSANFLNLSNIEAVEEGIYGFSIVLKMSNGSDKYILTRDVHPRDGIIKPNGNSS